MTTTPAYPAENLEPETDWEVWVYRFGRWRDYSDGFKSVEEVREWCKGLDLPFQIVQVDRTFRLINP